ncbi:hypothetical protein [Hahella sp. HN01]|uniref:hypothetical protein n=1 Tax=Hahella sp. HN01 TaxID=2847262 RepID=UPI001C1EB0FF|nr:hypothetical protein [Hahella sp. HN01]MBU6949825.1 hypothetical protein [Hahella sp. HN01]
MADTGLDIANRSMNDIPEMPDSPKAMNDMLKDAFAQAQKLALEREIMTMIHKLIMDSIKKIGQAA